MGRDLGRAALRRRRARSSGVPLAGALLVVALLAVSGGPVSADPVPTPTPTPSVSPPSQQQINDAKAALDRLRGQGSADRQRPSTRLAQVAGPTADQAPGVTSRISDQAWWTMGAGLLVLMVASETTRLRVRRAKHRKA